MEDKHTWNPKNLGLALGLLWGLWMIILWLGSMLFGSWPITSDLVAEWYPGAGPSFFGLVAGTFWGFVDGFVGGYLVAWVYNFFQKK